MMSLVPLALLLSAQAHPPASEGAALQPPSPPQAHLLAADDLEVQHLELLAAVPDPQRNTSLFAASSVTSPLNDFMKKGFTTVFGPAVAAPEFITDDVLAFTLIAVSPIILFFGFRLFPLILAMIGALLGGYLMGVVVPAFVSQYGNSDFMHTTAILTGIAGAFFGAVLLPVSYVVGVAAAGALGGVLVGMVFIKATASWGWFVDAYTYNEQVLLGVILIFSLLSLLCTLYAEHYIQIPLFPFLGSFCAITGADHFLKGPFAIEHWSVSITEGKMPSLAMDCTDAECVIRIIIWVLLFLSGFTAQLIQFRKTGVPIAK